MSSYNQLVEGVEIGERWTDLALCCACSAYRQQPGLSDTPWRASLLFRVDAGGAKFLFVPGFDYTLAATEKSWASVDGLPFNFLDTREFEDIVYCTCLIRYPYIRVFRFRPA